MGLFDKFYFQIFFVVVDTNLQKSDLPTGLAKDLCDVVAQILNKPIEVRGNGK